MSWNPFKITYSIEGYYVGGIGGGSLYKIVRRWLWITLDEFVGFEFRPHASYFISQLKIHSDKTEGYWRHKKHKS